MKRLKIITLPSANGKPPAKKECQLMRLIPVENINMSSPILLENVGNISDANSGEVRIQIAESLPEPENSDVVFSINVHMDITKPLVMLRMLLESRLGIDLSDYVFYLQDAQELDANRNLVNQCVQGQGMVQINVEVSSRDGVKKINIVDVLKPEEEVTLSESLDIQGNDTTDSDFNSASGDMIFHNEELSSQNATTSSQDNITRWVAASDFLQMQCALNIPQDPQTWTTDHVKLWIQWATTRFISSFINTAQWKIDGKTLLNMTREEFRVKVPIDPDDLFWTHLELLRKCKIVAVLQQNDSPNQKPVTKVKPKPNKPVGSKLYDASNCQTQLWQFLLELLTDKDHRMHIQWVGTEGEFKLINPEMVAYLWGKRKNKPTMNYEKLSRALRYYYDGELIAKVHGKRFVYKFVYDLKKLLGYSAAELNKLVCEHELRSIEKDIAPSISSGSSTNNIQFLSDSSVP